jgi:hypothetical protein
MPTSDSSFWEKAGSIMMKVCVLNDKVRRNRDVLKRLKHHCVFGHAIICF